MPVLASHSVPDEYRAARHGAALFEQTGRELVRVTGSERLSFLQGMLSCDVKRLPEEGVCPAALLTPKGALVADARVWRREADLLIETGPGLGSKVREHLARHLVSEDAELFEETGELAAVSLLGPTSRDVLGLMAEVPAGQYAALEVGSARVLATAPWLFGRVGLDLLVPRAELTQWTRQLLERGLTRGLRQAGTATYEVLRIESGVPRFGSDLDGGTLVLEAGLERALSFEKGCYVGQEAVARATHRGQVQRKLRGLLLDAEAAPGAVLLREGKEVGHLTSVAHSEALGRFVALGYVRRESFAEGTCLDLEGRPRAATVHGLPFV